MRTALLVPPAALLVALLPSVVLAQREGAPDSAAADTVAETVADTTAETAAQSADTAAAAADTTEPAARELPSLEGFRKIAILSRDMLPGTPGYETWVEVYRGPDRAQVVRFVTGGVAWALVVRPAGETESYTLRDFDCSGGFTEELQAGTPLAVPDCATPAPSPAPPPPDD